MILGVGSSHDNSVFQRSNILRHPNRYFLDKSAYLLADQGYVISNWVIPPFRARALENSTEGNEAIFNTRLSSARVNVEHAIGLIKARFPQLRTLSMVVGREHENARVVNLITAACTLHNILLDFDDRWTLDREDREALDVQMDLAYEDIRTSRWFQFMTDNEGLIQVDKAQKLAGEYKREALMDYILTHRNEGRRVSRWWRR